MGGVEANGDGGGVAWRRGGGDSKAAATVMWERRGNGDKGAVTGQRRLRRGRGRWGWRGGESDKAAMMAMEGGCVASRRQGRGWCAKAAVTVKRDEEKRGGGGKVAGKGVGLNL